MHFSEWAGSEALVCFSKWRSFQQSAVPSIKKNKNQRTEHLPELAKETFTLSGSLYKHLHAKFKRMSHPLFTAFLLFVRCDCRTIIIPMAMTTGMRVTQYPFFCVLYHRSFLHPFIDFFFYNAYCKISAHTHKMFFDNSSWIVCHHLHFTQTQTHLSLCHIISVHYCVGLFLAIVNQSSIFKGFYLSKNIDYCCSVRHATCKVGLPWAKLQLVSQTICIEGAGVGVFALQNLLSF